MDIALILILILINGVFAMSELAIVSSRKARLQELAKRGRGAQTALALHDDPSRFLSTVQVGITSVGILAGAIGDAALAGPLTQQFAQIPFLAPYAKAIALAITVLLITYFSVVVGELVPKQLALLNPERIASLISRPMSWLARAASPVVWALSSSSRLLLRALGARRQEGPPITDQEIKALMEQGAQAGVFHASERQFVYNVLKLDEMRVGAIMTPRKQIVAIDLSDAEADVRAQIADSPHARLLVCEDGIEHTVGVLERATLLKPVLEGRPINVRKAMRAPLFIPDTVTAIHLLELFRKSKNEFAVVIDEYSEVQGVVTLNDVLSAIVGDVAMEEALSDPDIRQRQNGSWLVDGGTAVERIKSLLDIHQDLPGEEINAYHTLGGFVMHRLERVPRATDNFEYLGWRFEVVDMDDTRVDKVLIERAKGQPPA